jgi:hypothetical protein
MRYAVVFKTYAWDAFVHRQAARCQAAAGSGDFFISIDETNGQVGSVPFERVVRTSNAELIAAGFANRYEKGSLLWWNPDYVHYQFQELYPDYDYYVFIEYDVVVQASLEHLVAGMAADQVDLVDLPIRMPKDDWHWTLFHLQTYAYESLQGALICTTAFSRRALELLARRRRQMAGENVSYWPTAEVFIPTEIARAGYHSKSLAAFGGVDRYDWFPPVLEDDLAQAGGGGFLHPVLDRGRFLTAMLKTTARFRSFLYPRSKLWKSLARFPSHEYLPRLHTAAYRRLCMSINDRVQQRRLRRTINTASNASARVESSVAMPGLGFVDG